MGDFGGFIDVVGSFETWVFGIRRRGEIVARSGRKNDPPSGAVNLPMGFLAHQQPFCDSRG